MYASKSFEGFGPLSGVRVIELAEWVAAPAAVRCLGEMGAEVIKVENPAGDPQRTQCYGFGGRRTEECDPTYENVNANKDWISLNLKTEEEAYDNDALRRYESKDFGPRVFNTAPLRFGSYGDPSLVLGKPVGYHTERFLCDKGYSGEQIAALEEKGAVRCWHGEDLDDIPVLRSKRDLAGDK